jgi:hypothetical protein
MTIPLKSVFLSAALAAMILPAAAQSTDNAAAPSPTAPAAQKQNSPAERQEHQQSRIAGQIKSGELTASEAAKLEKQESKLSQEAQAMKKANGGKLTAADRKKIEGQENKLSKEIYKQSHDAQKLNPDPKTALGKREENQQDRIANGISTGKLTAAEASRLENQQRKINQEVGADRAANGGKLTPEERANLNRQMNRESRRIHNQKHDAQQRRK